MTIRAVVEIVEPLPPGIGYSYGTLKFAKFGACRWEYANGFCGPVHWINFQKSCFEPEYINMKQFRVWMRPGFLYRVDLIPVVDESVPDMLIANKLVNLLTGTGLPFAVPF